MKDTPAPAWQVGRYRDYLAMLARRDAALWHVATEQELLPLIDVQAAPFRPDGAALVVSRADGKGARLELLLAGPGAGARP